MGMGIRMGIRMGVPNPGPSAFLAKWRLLGCHIAGLKTFKYFIICNIFYGGARAYCTFPAAFPTQNFCHIAHTICYLFPDPWPGFWPPPRLSLNNSNDFRLRLWHWSGRFPSFPAVAWKNSVCEQMKHSDVWVFSFLPSKKKIKKKRKPSSQVRGALKK